MKKLVALVLLAACELQPAPPKQEPPPAPAPPPPAAPVEAPPPAPPPVVADAGVADGPPKIEISPPCLEVAVKVAQVIIDNAKDPVQHTAYEQERANMTRKVGEACTTQGWSETARKCYLVTKTPEEITACDKKFTPKQQVEPPKQPVAPVPGNGPTGTTMKPEPPKPAQPKPAKPAKH